MTNQRGFTVIEVLIASFILFLVISSASLIFSSTVKSKQAATQSLLLYSYVPILMDHIDVQVRTFNSKREGEGYFFGVNYYWKANVADRKPVESRENSAATIKSEAILFNVELRVTYGNKIEVFNFQSLSWQAL